MLPLARPGGTYDSLPRFHDQVGVLYAQGAEQQLAPDPFFAADAVPPLTSAFTDVGANREILPAFDAARCTGCGDCWTACPDGAIGVSWLGTRALVDAGIDLAKRRGQSSDALRMLAGKLATTAGALARHDDPPLTVGALLREAFADVVERTPPAADRREALDAAIDAVATTAGDLPVTAARDIPRDPAGQPEVLLFAIDPAACKACGLCVAVCEPEALSSAPRDDTRVAAARAACDVLDELPDTPGKAIERLLDTDVPGRAAALSLSRHARVPMASGDPAEPGSGARLALRLVLGAVEAHGQASASRLLDAVASLHGEVGEKIRASLAAALPSTDLDALAEGLHALGRPDVSLHELAERVERAHDSGPIDAAALDALVVTGRKLADLAFAIRQGPQGLGRARASLVVAASDATAWACTFPQNPFQIPVAVDTSGRPAALAEGLLAGTADAFLDDVRLLRRARLVLDRPREAAHAEGQLATLDLDALTDEERTFRTPLVVFAAARDLAGDAGFERLLRSGEPVIVLALADADPSGSPDLGIGSLLARDAFVTQSSVARPDHLVAAVLQALRHGGPALLHVHAPSPARDGIAPGDVLGYAEQAIATRTFPLFVYDPHREGTFGTRLDLAGNPATASGPPAHERCLALWRTLREIAGLETPFTQRVRADLEQEVRATHAAELATVEREHEARVAELRAGVEAELANRLRDKLVTLAMRGAR